MGRNPTTETTTYLPNGYTILNPSDTTRHYTYAIGDKFPTEVETGATYSRVFPVGSVYIYVGSSRAGRITYFLLRCDDSGTSDDWVIIFTMRSF